VSWEDRVAQQCKTGASFLARGMSMEMESACHSMSRGILGQHLDAKYGVGKWGVAGIAYDTHERDGKILLSGTDLGKESVEAGLEELRRQLAAYDAAMDLTSAQS
jgi:hypothetical protein